MTPPSTNQAGALRQPSRTVLAYSGLVALLAMACLLTGFAPSEAGHGALGGIMIVAALLGLLIEAIAPSPASLTLRIAWAAVASVTGLVMILAPLLVPVAPGLVLAGFLSVQAAILIVFALRARRRHEIGARSLTADGLVSLALAIFVFAAYPFSQQWVLGSIVAVGLLDYAAALAFREFDGR
jgi:drug/metabolite transporter superfamily protein YnfA